MTKEARCLLACVAGAKKGKGEGESGERDARGKGKGNACSWPIVYFILPFINMQMVRIHDPTGCQMAANQNVCFSRET